MIVNQLIGNPNVNNSNPDVQRDIDQLENELISFLKSGNSSKIAQIEADIAQLEKDLPGSAYSYEQVKYIQQAIQDAQNAIQTYQNTGTVDITTFIHALAELNTSISSNNCSNNPTALAAMDQAMIILYSSEIMDGVLTGSVPNSSEMGQLKQILNDASSTLSELAPAFSPSLQDLINQLCGAIQSPESSIQQIALLAQQLIANLNS